MYCLQSRLKLATVFREIFDFFHATKVAPRSTSNVRLHGISRGVPKDVHCEARLNTVLCPICLQKYHRKVLDDKAFKNDFEIYTNKQALEWRFAGETKVNRLDMLTW